MSLKLIVSVLIFLLVVTLSGDVFARAVARWVGPFAYASAHTRVIGVPFCDTTVVYPFTTPNLPIQAFCQSWRDPWTNGGAFAYAICDTLPSGRKWSSAWSFAFGMLAWAGKSTADTIRCSTEVVSSISGGLLNMDIYAMMHSADVKQGAILRLDVIAKGDTIFTGRAEVRGHPDSLKASGGFSASDFVAVEGNVVINRSFNGINVSGYESDSVDVRVSSDTQSYMQVPSSTPYGLVVLVLALLASAAYVFYRRRVRTAAG